MTARILLLLDGVVVPLALRLQYTSGSLGVGLTALVKKNNLTGEMMLTVPYCFILPS